MIISQLEILHIRIIMSGIITNFVGQIYADSGYLTVGRVGLKTYKSVYFRLILG